MGPENVRQNGPIVPFDDSCDGNSQLKISELLHTNVDGVPQRSSKQEEGRSVF